MNGIHGAAVGRLVADPEYRFTANGNPLLTFRIAAEEQRQDGQKGETQFIAVSVFGDLAVGLHDSGGGKLAKGGEAYCEGRLRLATWQGSDGTPRSGLNLTAWTVTPMGVLGRKPTGNGNDNGNGQHPARSRDMVSRGGVRPAGFGEPVAAGAETRTAENPPW